MAELVLAALFLIASAYQVSATVRAWAFSRRRSREVPPRLRYCQVKPLYQPSASSLAAMESFLRAEDPGPERGHDFYVCSPEDAPAEWLSRWPQVTWLKLAADQSRNGKAAILSLGERYWSGEIFIISDADMTCSPDYLRAVLGEFADPDVGAVTCLYRGSPGGKGPGALLESLCILDFSLSVLVAEWSEGIGFAMGSTMAVRREVLDRIGGFRALVPYLADDFQLGDRVRQAGFRVALAPTVLDTEIGSPTLKEALAHQYRWMVTSRVSRPWGHLAFIVTQGLPWALALCLLDRELGSGLVALWCSLRILLGALQSSLLRGAGSGRDLLELLLLPVKDLLYPALWAASLVGRKVRWGAREIEVDPQGRIKPA